MSYYNTAVKIDIIMSTKQCARFCSSPSGYHKEAVKHICRYLMRTKYKGLILIPYKQRIKGCYVDYDWAGSWKDRSINDLLSSYYRAGYIIMFPGYPIMWSSNMQPFMALNTTEVGYIALSAALS